ncbi:hypothetical protein HCC61_24445 [Streptomyces sp. HNM0575]|uniref:hypothetical protein n=1 Tax=Streptomyces sp. HNM0575 TaxID=2716338 RepID=UPI00145FA8BA|nr:hypothetical protein [Streptomyces sp. HNM0575]NLU75762.1 hypothetical protein [Streptomyces sp. HNM0575]
MADEEKAGGCGVCAALLKQVDKAVGEYDRSAEVDARVKLRRHMRQIHGRELPLAW